MRWLIPTLFVLAVTMLVRLVHHFYPIPFWVQFGLVGAAAYFFTNWYDDKLEGK